MKTTTTCDTCRTPMGSRGFVNHPDSVRCADLRASYIRGFRNGKINGREVVVEDVLDAMGLSRSAMADTGGTLTSGQVRRPLTVTAILDKIVGD